MFSLKILILKRIGHRVLLFSSNDSNRECVTKSSKGFRSYRSFMTDINAIRLMIKNQF